MAITKEWLKQTISELEQERDATPGVVNEDASKALEAMRIALASIEAKPVYFVEIEGDQDINAGRIDGKNRPDLELLPDGMNFLYAVPPAPVVMDEVLSRELFEKWCSVNIERNKWHPEYYAHYPATGQWGAWEACRAAMLQGADGKPELTVWYGSMPETNGKTNWTAMLHRKGQHPLEGITIECSEYPDRVRYEADRMRHLIGELEDEPDILAYDSEAHSGYVYPANSPVIPDGCVLVPVEPTYQMCKAMGLPWESPRFPDRYKAMIATAPKV